MTEEGKRRTTFEAIDSRRVAIVVGVALVSSVLVLLIQRFVGAGDWDEALAGFVQIVATAVVIVGLLEWYRRRRWQRAEDEDLRSLILLSGVIPSGWRRLSPYRSTAPSSASTTARSTTILVLYENFAADYETSTLNLLERLDLSCPEDFEFELRMKRQSDRINDDWTKRYSELRLGRDFDLFPVPREEKAREGA